MSRRIIKACLFFLAVLLVSAPAWCSTSADIRPSESIASLSAETGAVLPHFSNTGFVLAEGGGNDNGDDNGDRDQDRDGDRDQDKDQDRDDDCNGPGNDDHGNNHGAGNRGTKQGAGNQNQGDGPGHGR
jgi:hypothetical protein